MSLALILGAALLLSHPYTGIRHDGILYAGEAIARILPGQFRDDPYFLFGSQGRFTLLPAVHAALIGAFGLGAGTIVGMLVAFALYLVATACLIAGFAPERLRAVCILGVVLGWNLYGGHRIFGYSEPFLTARSFAEPAALAALAFAVRRRWIGAALALIVAFAFHPLIALGAALVLWIFFVLQDRRWLIVAAVALVAFVACAAVGWAPLGDVFARYDPHWLDYVRQVNPQAFVLTWTALDYGFIVFDAIVLLFAVRSMQDARHRRFVLATLFAGLGAVLVSTLLVDVALSPFFGKLQIWRALWLMQWLAMAVTPLVVVALWRNGEQGRIAALFVGLGWLAPFTVAPGLLALMALSIDTIGRRIVISAATTRIVAGVAGAAALVIAVQFELRVFQIGSATGQSIAWMAGQAMALGSFLTCAALVWIRYAERIGRAAPVIALVVFVSATLLWDQRSPWKHELESHRPGATPWPGLIEPGARVYWYRDLMAPWVLLGHGNYYTDQQASGAVFSRAMVIELEKRQKLTGLLDFQEQICQMMNNLSGRQGACEPDAAAVRTLCVDGGIDYVVLQSALEGSAPTATYATGVTENGYEKKFFLYRCSSLDRRG